MTTATKTPGKRSKLRPSQELSKDDLLKMLESMMLIRRFEERTAQSYQQAKIGGFCHLYIGQEAVAVGSIGALRPDDPIITAYRDHGHALARGMHPNYAMAEMYGKITGCAKGKGGSMHFFDKANHMYGGHAIVGGQIPLGVGLAFATQYLGEDKVTACYFGDGAINQGAFHEALNLAAIWKLPIIFALENNMYSMGTSIGRGTAMSEDLSKKAAAYGMRYATCDGMDVLDTYDVFKAEADRIRAAAAQHTDDDASRKKRKTEDLEAGPVFIEIMTYRYKGHSMSDPQKYRTKEEVSKYEDVDCINRLVNHLIENKLATQEQLEQMDKQAKKLATDAVKYANESPDTPVEELYTDVYSEPFGPYKKGELPLMLREDENEADANE